MKKLLSFSTLVLCNTLALFAQGHSIKGIVIDDRTLEPISGANVIVKHRTDNNIVTYTTTVDKGTFSLHIICKDLTEYSLHVTCLGFEQQILDLKGSDYSIRLKEKAFEIKEVSVRADKISQRQDTTSYFVAGFAQAKDRTIGDVLTNMPGIHVADNGSISYNGSPINRFYIEGIDLFDGKYSLATNNISYENIARVEIIENHQAIKALQGTGIDTGTAINLKLKDKAKSTWNGNLLGKGGFSPDDGLWESELFTAFFSVRNQSATTLKSNNSGKNIADEGQSLTVEDLLYRYPDSEISGSLSSAPALSTNLGSDRTRFNRTHMFSNSSMWKCSPSSQFRTQLIFTDDKNAYDQTIESSYFLSGSQWVHGTKETSSVKDRGLQASLTAAIDKDSYFLSDELAFHFNRRAFASTVEGDFNHQSIANINTYHVKNKLKYVKKAGSNIFQILSLSNYTFIPEALYVDGETIRRQSIEKGNFFSNTNFRFIRNIRRWSVGTNIDLFGSIYHFCSLYDHERIQYQNALTTNYIGARWNPEIIYQNETFKLSARLPLSVYGFGGEQSATRIYVKPDVYVKWRFLPRWTLFANAAVGSMYPGNNLYYTAPIMTDYRSMNAGFLNYEGKVENRIGGRISHANPSEMFFANLSVTYSDENMKRRISKRVDKGGVFYSYEPGDDRYKLLFADGNISKGIEPINGSVEWNCSLQNHNMPTEQNGDASAFDFGNVNLGMTLKSNPYDWVNVDYKTVYRYSYIKSDRFENKTRHWIQKCLLTFYPTEDISIKLNGEHYLTFFDSGQKKNTFFADIDLVYRYKQFDIIASATNLFNQNIYQHTTYGDLSSTGTRYNLRGRNIMVGLIWYY